MFFDISFCNYLLKILINLLVVRLLIKNHFIKNWSKNIVIYIIYF